MRRAAAGPPAGSRQDPVAGAQELAGRPGGAIPCRRRPPGTPARRESRCPRSAPRRPRRAGQPRPADPQAGQAGAHLDRSNGPGGVVWVTTSVRENTAPPRAVPEPTRPPPRPPPAPAGPRGPPLPPVAQDALGRHRPDPAAQVRRGRRVGGHVLRVGTAQVVHHRGDLGELGPTVRAAVQVGQHSGRASASGNCPSAWLPSSWRSARCRSSSSGASVTASRPSRPSLPGGP